MTILMPKTKIDRKIIGYNQTYNFGERIMSELSKMNQIKRRLFIKYFDIGGIGAYTALEGVKGNTFALRMIKEKTRSH